MVFTVSGYHILIICCRVYGVYKATWFSSIHLLSVIQYYSIMESKDEYSLQDKILIFVAAMIGWSHDAVGLTLTNFLAEPIMEEFNVDKFLMGFVFSAQFIATVPGALLFGYLADRFGRKKALIYSVLWDSILTAITYFSPNFFVLALLRILSGMGVSWGIGYALLSEAYSPKHRGLFGGLIHSTFIIGYAISAGIVYLLYPIYGWRVPYLIALYPIPIIAILSILLPESKLWRKYQELELSDEEGISRDIFKELSSPKILRLTVLASILFWGSEFAYHAWVDWAPTLLSELYGYDVSIASGIILIISLFVGLSLPIVGFISDYIGRKKAFIYSSSIGLLGSIIFGAILFIMGDVESSFYLIFIIPFGFTAHSLYGIWASELFPTRVRATAVSLTFSIARGLSLGGFIVGATSNIFSLAGSMFIFGFIGFILMVTIPIFLPETKGKPLD